MRYFFIVFILSINSLFSESFSDINYNYFLVNNTWMLSFNTTRFHHAFRICCLETGLTQSKNTVNILLKILLYYQ